MPSFTVAATLTPIMDNGSTGKRPLFVYRFGSVAIDEARFELQISGLPVEIEQKPLRVLIELARRANQVVTRDDMLDAVWGGRPTVPNVLTNAIAKLRKALGERESARIVTVAGIGYQLNAEVEKLAGGMQLLSRLQLNAGDSVAGREHFLLKRRIGATQSSEVWLARHRKTGDPLVFKFSPDGSHLPALKREVRLYRVLRETLGERDDIVKIVDWNFESAPYHIVCEYGGEDLARWAAKDGQLAQLPRELRLQVFIKVAEAVAVAHGVGVLHRDIKPGNVLIAADGTAAGRIRVADFGSGGLLEPGLLQELSITQTSSAISDPLTMDSHSGTLLYSAPELLAGNSATVRSDIYALGLMLYQILCGDLKRPLAPGWEQDIDDELLREDIVASTHVDPDQRLASAAELCDRLRRLEQRRAERRHAHDVQRRFAAAERRMQRTRARRPWVLSSIGLLLAGVVISLVLYRQARIQAQEARRQTEAVQAINGFLRSILSQANPNEAGATDISIHEAIARAEAGVDRQFANEPPLAASIHLTLAETDFRRGQLADATRHARQALDLLRGSQGETAPLTQQARYELALALAYDSKFEESAAVAAQADQSYDAATATAPLVLASNYVHGMLLLQKVDRIAESIPYFRRALDAQRLVAPGDAGNTLELQSKLAQALVFSERYSEAEALLKSMLEREEDVDASTTVRLSQARETYGEMLTFQKRYAEAEPVLLRAHADMVKGLGGENYRTTKSLADLASLYASTGQWPRARDTYGRVIASLTQQIGPDSALTLAMTGWLGAVEYEAGDVEAAIRKLKRSRDALGKAYPEFGAPYLHCFSYYLASAYVARNALDEAEALIPGIDGRLAAEICGDDPFSARMDALRAEILISRGNPAQGFPLLKSALDELRSHDAPGYLVARLQQKLAAVSR